MNNSLNVQKPLRYLETLILLILYYVCTPVSVSVSKEIFHCFSANPFNPGYKTCIISMNNSLNVQKPLRYPETLILLILYYVCTPVSVSVSKGI